MAELEIPTGFINCHFKFQQSGVAHPSTFAIGFDATAFSGNLDTFATAIASAWIGAYGLANILDSYVFLGVKLYLGPGDPFLVGEDIRSNQGTASGAPLTSNTTLLLKKTTGVAGVRYRGRMYSPALQVAETGVTGYGTIDATTRTNTQARYDLAFAAMQAVTGVGPYVLFHAPSEDSATPPPTVISSLILEPVVATQRRRMR